MSELDTRDPVESSNGITSVAIDLSRQSFPPIYQDSIGVPALQHLDFGQRALAGMPVMVFVMQCKDKEKIKTFLLKIICVYQSFFYFSLRPLA